MFLAALKLINFRNYDRQELTFHPRLNIFTGLNAQGKTNLLEAVYCLAVSRSFRTNQESELLRFGSDFFYLEGNFQKKKECYQVGIGYRPPRRLQIKLNGKTLKRAEYLHRHPVVVFSPDDLLLVKEGPSIRRRFLDTEGSRLKPLYYRRLRDYYRALQQRNRILKEYRGSRSFDYSLLEPWDQALVKFGSTVMKERIKFLGALEGRARSHFATLTAESESLSLRYLPTIKFNGDFELLESAFREQLTAGHSAELRRGTTLVGPHLDDFAVMINGCDVRKYGSQGQQRTVVLALKMGEVDLFNSAGDEQAILLLDDIFSEFDEERSNHLLQFLSCREGQSFLTTASPSWKHSQNCSGQSKIYTVYRGKIKID